MKEMALLLALVGGTDSITSGFEHSTETFPHIPCLSHSGRQECKSSHADLFHHCLWCKSKTVFGEKCLTPELAENMRLLFKCESDDDDDNNDDDGNMSSTEGFPVTVTEQWASYYAWKDKHGVHYEDEIVHEERFQVFQANVEEAIRHNMAASLGGAGPVSYTLGVNRFSDMTWEEFQATRLGFGTLGMNQNCSATHHREDSQYRALGLSTDRPPPPRRDWREVGAVSGVKNQENCGSCWTFSTTGCLESHHYLRTGEMVRLSEQQLVDCAGAYDNHGCSGGLPSHAFEYIARAGGLDTEEAYPYIAEQSGSCAFVNEGVGAGVMRAVNITFQDEAELLEAVGNTGPVSVAFQVAPDFKAYVGGVYDNPVCSTLPEKVNHAVLCVGYDTTEDGVDYWIMKNSWGSDWGIDGYFHIARGKNMCGVADCASFPLVP